MQVRTPQGIKDVSLIHVTKENYIVPPKEEHLYHALIEVRKFDSNTGQRQSIPRIQIFGKKTFESGKVGENLKKQGYDVVILHDPNEWLATNKLKLEAQQAEENQRAMEAKAVKEAEDKKAADEAEQKRINDAVSAALKQQSAQQAEETQKAIDAAVKSALEAEKKKASEARAKAAGDAEKKSANKSSDETKKSEDK